MAEYWDIYGADGAKTGRLHRSDEPMRAGEYHLAVAVWIGDENGRWLISQRVPGIAHGGMWQTTEGGVIAGEESLQAALREEKEELGVSLLPENGMLWRKYTWQHGDDDGMVWYHTWVFRQSVPLESVVLQPGETCNAMWATPAEIRRMAADGTFTPYDYLEDLFALK